MPSIEQHLDKADRDLDAYNAIPEDFPEWRAVALFYSAVHSIEALCATGGSIHVDHYAREETVKTEHPQLWPRYVRLKQESEKARYLTRATAKRCFRSMRHRWTNNSLRAACSRSGTTSRARCRQPLE